ncbi:MAG: hypothetical protein IPO90_07755 [Flavobacteriales bacterium]|nr:hypothetical protein [Flavobacteriales bacterium]
METLRKQFNDESLRRLREPRAHPLLRETAQRQAALASPEREYGQYWQFGSALVR